MLAGTVKDGIYVSADHGLTWRAANSGLVLLGVSPFWQQVIKGYVILAAVALVVAGGAWSTSRSVQNKVRAAATVDAIHYDLIVIGGGVSNLGNLLLSSIRQAVLGRSLPLATRNLQIVFSAIGPDSGVLGAVNLALDYIFTVEAANGNGKREAVAQS